MVKTEKSLRYLISQYAKKIKRLQQEVADSIARKKIAEVQLRELKWEAKEKKRNPWIQQKAVKAIETITTKILKKATKKKVDCQEIPPMGRCMPADPKIGFLGKKKA